MSSYAKYFPDQVQDFIDKKYDEVLSYFAEQRRSVFIFFCADIFMTRGVSGLRTLWSQFPTDNTSIDEFIEKWNFGFDPSPNLLRQKDNDIRHRGVKAAFERAKTDQVWSGTEIARIRDQSTQEVAAYLVELPVGKTIEFVITIVSDENLDQGSKMFRLGALSGATIRVEDK
jgi:hypothetical protein